MLRYGLGMGYPHSIAETVADGTVHAVGLGFAIPASFMLVMSSAGQDIPPAPIMIYAVCFLFSLSASALYHLMPFDQSRAFLGRIDHAAIYFKIAGTYTPVVATIGSGFAYAVLGLVWVLAIIGALAKLSFWTTRSKASLALYLGMGWLSVLLIWPMWHALPGTALTLILVGGFIYSVGTLIYAHPGMRYQNAIWHVFVLVASICLFAAIWISA